MFSFIKLPNMKRLIRLQLLFLVQNKTKQKQIMNTVYEKYVEGLKKNEIVQLKRKPNLHKIIVYAMEDDSDTWAESKRLNELFEKHDDKNYKKFIITEKVSVRKCYASTFNFSSKKCMASLARNEKFFLRYAKEAIAYMKNVISYNLANELHSVTITRG